MYAPQVFHWMLLHGHFGTPAIAASIAKHPAAWNAGIHGGMVRARLLPRSKSYFSLSYWQSACSLHAYVWWRSLLGDEHVI